VIARSGLPMAKVLGLFLYYNLIFILPLIVILMVMAGGKQIVNMKEWEHKNTKWMRFVLGAALVLVGVWIGIK
jgi:cytochrome c biogenesis protein CcdA